MADYITLPAQTRTVTGKKVSQLRRQGLTPFVVYGPQSDPIALQTETKALAKVLYGAGSSRLIAIEVEGEAAPRMVLARDVQRHVTKLSVLHADFLQVVMDETVRAEIPIEVVGESPAVKASEAILDIPMATLTIEALPMELPSSMPVDISEMLAPGDTITVSDLADAVGVMILHEPDEVIARLMHLRAVEEEPEVEEELVEGEEVMLETAVDDEDAEADTSD